MLKDNTKVATLEEEGLKVMIWKVCHDEMVNNEMALPEEVRGI